MKDMLATTSFVAETTGTELVYRNPHSFLLSIQGCLHQLSYCLTGQWTPFKMERDEMEQNIRRFETQLFKSAYMTMVQRIGKAWRRQIERIPHQNAPNGLLSFSIRLLLIFRPFRTGRGLSLLKYLKAPKVGEEEKSTTSVTWNINDCHGGRTVRNYGLFESISMRHRSNWTEFNRVRYLIERMITRKRRNELQPHMKNLIST